MKGMTDKVYKETYVWFHYNVMISQEKTNNQIN